MSALHAALAATPADTRAQGAPRHFTRAPAVAVVRSPMPMPQQRLDRIAARRSFVSMKRLFVEAVASVEGGRGEWLRRQVRQAEAPVDLWLLRGAVYSALGGDVARRCEQRLELHQALDSVFPDSSFTPMAPR
jgi:hypothetical protein